MGNSVSSNASGSASGKVDVEDNDSSSSDVKELDETREPTEPFLCTSILRDPMPKIPSEMKNDFYELGFIKEDHVPVPYYWPVIQIDVQDTPTYIRNNWLHDTFRQQSSQGEKDMNMKRIVYRYSIDDFILIEADQIIPYNEGIEQGLDLLPKEIVHKLRTGKTLSILDLNLVLSRESLRVEARKPRKDRNVWKHVSEHTNNEVDEVSSSVIDDEESSTHPHKSRQWKRKRNHRSVEDLDDHGDCQFEDGQKSDSAHFIVTPERTKKKKRKGLCKARLHDMNLQGGRRVLDFGGESSGVFNGARLNKTTISNADDSKERDYPSISSIREDDELDEDDFPEHSIDASDKINNDFNTGDDKEVDDKSTNDDPTPSIGEHVQGEKEFEKEVSITEDDFKNPQESFIGKRHYKKKKAKDSVFLDSSSDSGSDNDISTDEISDSEYIPKKKSYSITKVLDTKGISHKELNIYMEEDRASLQQVVMSNLSTRIKESIHEICFARSEGKLYPVFVLSPFDLFPCESQSSYFSDYSRSGVMVFWYGYGQNEDDRLGTIYESEIVRYSEGIEEFEKALDVADPKVIKGIQHAKKDNKLPKEERLQWLFKAESAKYRFLKKMLKQDPITVHNYRSIGVIQFEGKPCPVLQICPLDIVGKIRDLFVESLHKKQIDKREIYVLLYGEKREAKNRFMKVEPHQFTPIEEVPEPYPDDRLVKSKGGSKNFTAEDKEYYLRWQHMRQDLNRSRIERPLSYSL
ncbi:predicted protein [Chaetoceros tenuissimus]|uniref:Uncharacterized protein n=1 Tax=Chaetoceros tenuissimus TaxID=426638 RepID=A0AAD3CUP4_9STRA|nr:predicted protein [Chaetoceros tenuissimus]